MELAPDGVLQEVRELQVVFLCKRVEPARDRERLLDGSRVLAADVRSLIVYSTSETKSLPDVLMLAGLDGVGNASP